MTVSSTAREGDCLEAEAQPLRRPLRSHPSPWPHSSCTALTPAGPLRPAQVRGLSEPLGLLLVVSLPLPVLLGCMHATSNSFLKNMYLLLLLLTQRICFH